MLQNYINNLELANLPIKKSEILYLLTFDTVSSIALDLCKKGILMVRFYWISKVITWGSGRSATGRQFVVIFGEVGLETNGGIPYQSIVYLVNEVTRPK